MFENQHVELLPARTTMSRVAPGPGGGSNRARGGDAVISQGAGGNTRQSNGWFQVSALNGNSINYNEGDATGGAATAGGGGAPSGPTLHSR